MINPDLIAAFKEVFKARPLTVRADDCLNQRHRAAGCDRCVRACPTQAITLVAGRPVLNDDRCVNCGACLHACPTDVFLLLASPEAELLRTHIELPREPHGLVCLVHQSPQETRAPVTRQIRHGRCLAGFSTTQLLELSQDGARPLWLDDTWCDRCPIGHAHAGIVREVRAANHLLRATGRPPAVHLVTEEAESLADAPHPVEIVEESRPELTRRGLFKMMTGRVQQRAVEVVEHLPPPKPAGPVPVEQRLPHRVPPSLRRLNAHLAALAPDPEHLSTQPVLPTAEIPYGQVLVNEAGCTACGLCARFCPTEALRMRSYPRDEGAKPDSFELAFRADLCVDCNICVVACPEQIVTRGDSLSPRVLMAGEWERRVAGELVECGQCGMPTRRQEAVEEVLCSICRRGPGGVHRPGAQSQLFSDLFRRLEDGSA